jgi:hypothetical protein
MTQNVKSAAIPIDKREWKYYYIFMNEASFILLFEMAFREGNSSSRTIA